MSIAAAVVAAAIIVRVLFLLPRAQPLWLRLGLGLGIRKG
jgi:hypothetical protein